MLDNLFLRATWNLEFSVDLSFKDLLSIVKNVNKGSLWKLIIHIHTYPTTHTPTRVQMKFELLFIFFSNVTWKNIQITCKVSSSYAVTSVYHINSLWHDNDFMIIICFHSRDNLVRKYRSLFCVWKCQSLTCEGQLMKVLQPYMY